MRTLRLDLTYDIEEHVPIRILAEGSSLPDLIDNAEYCVDCPDPKHYYPIDHLSTRSWNAVQELIEREWLDHMQARSGAQ